jgi:hypothetical protein
MHRIILPHTCGVQRRLSTEKNGCPSVARISSMKRDVLACGCFADRRKVQDYKPEALCPFYRRRRIRKAEDALTLARALVNDSAGVVFADTLLMPLLNSAYRALQWELAENGVGVLVEQQDIELDLNGSTGTTNAEISDGSSPQLFLLTA